MTYVRMNYFKNQSENYVTLNVKVATTVSNLVLAIHVYLPEHKLVVFEITNRLFFPFFNSQSELATTGLSFFNQSTKTAKVSSFLTMHGNSKGSPAFITISLNLSPFCMEVLPEKKKKEVKQKTLVRPGILEF